MADAVWQMTLALYDQPGVAPACLALQARQGIGVSALLALMGVAAAGYAPLEPARLPAVLARAQAWQREVIEPLRSARRGIRQASVPVIAAPAESLRGALQDREIEAERLQQRLVIEDYEFKAAAPSSWMDAVTRNAQAYLACQNKTASSGDEADLERILAPLLNGAIRRPGLQRS